MLVALIFKILMLDELRDETMQHGNNFFQYSDKKNLENFHLGI